MPTYTDKNKTVRVDSCTFSEDEDMVTFYGEQTTRGDEYGGTGPWTLQLQSRFCRYKNEHYLLPEFVSAPKHIVSCLHESPSESQLNETDSKTLKTLRGLAGSLGKHPVSDLRMYRGVTCYKMEVDDNCIVKQLVDDSLVHSDPSGACVTWDACSPIHVPSKSVVSQFLTWVADTVGLRQVTE